MPLSSQGRLWSYTNNCYAPPPPYVAADPFVPYAIAAVELERERMVVLGQVESGIDVAQLEVGMPMELCVGKLYDDAEHEFVTWKWRPLAAGRCEPRRALSVGDARDPAGGAPTRPSIAGCRARVRPRSAFFAEGSRFPQEPGQEVT